MKTKAILKPIALNEKSLNVGLLHKTMEVLGSPVSKEEVSQGSAGPDTLKQVRALQSKLNVTVDASTLVNEATLRAIEEALEKRGLTAASRSFTASGTVRLPNGEVKKRQNLVAFLLDLHGVAVYRTVKSLADIKKTGGFELLGETTSDNRGGYKITFFDWQYERGERKKADVVIYALNKEEIVGLSRMVNSEDYSDKGLVRDLDVIITRQDGKTEYEVLMGELTAFLKENKTSLVEIAKSADQMAFTAGELDVDLLRLQIAAGAELLGKQEEEKLSHELLYGIGRQNISLTWASLYKKQEEELNGAIKRSVDGRIIRPFLEKDVIGFISLIRELSAKHVLIDKKDDKNSLNAMLANVLPDEKQRLSFLRALGSFKGRNFREFWEKHLPAQPEFKGKPELISGLLLTQQFTLLTGNHQPLVEELQVNRKLASMHDLFELKEKDWLEAIKKTGIPDSIPGKNEEERTGQYFDQIQTLLNAAFPTQRIARTVWEDGEIKKEVRDCIGTFLSSNKQFDFARSRIHNFAKQIEAASGKYSEEVKRELMKNQRVFQVSPNPRAMSVLKKRNLHSAYTIASIPRKSFIKRYAKELGGEDVAFAVHERASYINTRAEMVAMHVMEYSHGYTPQSVMGKAEYQRVMNALKKTPVDWTTLFGSPDFCECEHCRSVLSPAAYLVDLLRFLKFGVPNSVGKTPLDILDTRRPDLLHLPLTCENTNIVIPYIDLVNEVMEYYVAFNKIDGFEGYDTRDVTAEELRADPQYFTEKAYENLKDAKYPFSLPYHQLLDVIRTYSDHLKVSRYEAMKAVNPLPDAITTRAMEAESLGISPEEYIIIAGQDFSGNNNSTQVQVYYGYDAADSPFRPEGAGNVREFLKRSGVTYTELVELVKTQFINPDLGMLDFLERVFSHASIRSSAIYAKLAGIKNGTIDPERDQEIKCALDSYNEDKAVEDQIRPDYLKKWVVTFLDNFLRVITLYDPDSRYDLEKTWLRVMQMIYEQQDKSGIPTARWSNIHRFIRLWRKLGWTIHETDLMLKAIGYDVVIYPDTISRLESISLLKTATGLPLDQLAVLWGNIDTYGNQSLYKKLFLNKAVQQIDDAFKADASGKYLENRYFNPTQETLSAHRSTIIGAYKITEENLDSVFGVAMVLEKGKLRKLEMNSAELTIGNLSAIYRYVVLAKALKMKLTDLCRIIRLFNPTPFWAWDSQQKIYYISPAETYRFYKLVVSIKDAGFKPAVLEYIFTGTVPPDSAIGLDRDKVFQTARAIRDALAAIERDNPETPVSPLTAQALAAKMLLTFQPEVVAEFMGILENTWSFEAALEPEAVIPYYPDVAIPEDLADKYSYNKKTGRLTCKGVMLDDEQSALKNLTNAPGKFEGAVGELYMAPEDFINSKFFEAFGDIQAPTNDTKKKLLDRTPPRSPDSDRVRLDEKFAYVYVCFLPYLKDKLRRDAVIKYIAALIGLSEAATGLLIAAKIDDLVKGLSMAGFSATYDSVDAVGSPSTVLTRIDSAVNFLWVGVAPDPLVPAAKFDVTWNAYIAAPASGQYTLRVEVKEPHETFKLSLDGELIPENSGNSTSGVFPVDINATQMPLLKLEYTQTRGNAGVKLLWNTAGTAPEVIPASVAFPTDILDTFVRKATVYHRAAKLISGFEISETELNHLIDFNGDFGDINFEVIKPADWQRIRNYTILRNAVPQAQALLTDVFALANRTKPSPPAVDELTELLHLTTNWDKVSLGYLVTSHFKLGVNDFKSEMALSRIHEVMKIVTKTGVSARTVVEWSSADTDFTTLLSISQLMKNTVKAKYEAEDWLSVAGGLSDKIRENQKQALISYLLVQKGIRDWGVKGADGLFEYFLIDVQMSACMDTSRIVQANASVQMFVNRCLLNLESKTVTLPDGVTKSETGVSPDAIDKDRWESIKNYRVWEANRKIFLTPENWLEPEWRNNRSELFKELESYLVQNDITDRSVEQALRNYLSGLNEVANLDICGIYDEYCDNGSRLKYLHVFARTRNAPYKFFYRKRNRVGKWSAWEKVQVDIRCVEEGNNNGVHLIPIVWEKRLFLFWPEFMEMQKPPEIMKEQKPLGNGPLTIETVAAVSISALEPIKYWEIRLAWSEYLDGKWSPKQLTKEYMEFSLINETINAAKGDLTFYTRVDSKAELTISSAYRKATSLCRPCPFSFALSDIQSKVNIIENKTAVAPQSLNHFMKHEIKYPPPYFGPLTKSEDYFTISSCQEYFSPSSLQGLIDYCKKNPDLPSLFYQDASRTYYMHKVISTPNDGIIAGINNPNILKAIDVSKVIMSVDNINIASGVIAEPKSVLNNYKEKIVHVGNAFSAGIADINFTTMERSNTTPESEFNSLYTMGNEFHTFYHPFAGQFMTNLNQGGLSRGNKPPQFFPPGLMESNTEIVSDNGSTFIETYDPIFEQGQWGKYVIKPFDFDKREKTYYKENICFDINGAYSQYNWELFFHAPLYIATRLSKNGKFKEAMKWFHYIFDPTTDEPPVAEGDTTCYWKVLPFKTNLAEKLEDWFMKLNEETDPLSELYNPNSEFRRIVSEWRDNPFDPHLVASDRPLAYMKHVVMKYVENLITWGDSLFRRFTKESVDEALQIYVLASHILGPKPESIPKRGIIKPVSYSSMEGKWDDFSNALVEFENIFPYSSDVSVGASSTGPSILGIGRSLYFCIPPNDKLLKYWETVADRLRKIRHCQDIEGAERRFPLLEPPISPELLIQARSQGLSLGSILADLSSPPPNYRFGVLIQKVNEFCGEVKALGSALLSAIEKRDAEEMSRLRASHETGILELMTAVKERQVLDARVTKENLLKARRTAEYRLRYYMEDLMGNEPITVLPPPTVEATLTADSQLPIDTIVPKSKANMDNTLVKTDETGVKLIATEKKEMDESHEAHGLQEKAAGLEMAASMAHIIPTLQSNLEPLGVGFGGMWGGTQLGNALSATGKVFQYYSNKHSYRANVAAKLASYIRREQGWTHEANLAAMEIIRLDKDITSADIGIQVAEHDLSNHKKQIENSKEVELFLKDKFTKQELYQWMREQLFAIYKQSYNIAYDMAKKAQKAYEYELGTEATAFIQYGYWDDSNQGLVAGERLQMALRQMEKSYLEENRRDLELTKSVSLALMNPLALIKLRENGVCRVSIPEELFDLDFQGHYFRRIKSVSLSIPCVAGPYTAVNCSLRLLSNTTRINTSVNGGANYERDNTSGGDLRFRTSHVPVTSIATSTGQNDAGMFEFDFRDERYLPFEGAGAITEWEIELTQTKELRQFDYSTISDVIIHLKYTAREAGGEFKKMAADHMKNFIKYSSELPSAPLIRMFSMKHEFPSGWNRFLHPVTAGGEQVLSFTIGKERFPFFAQSGDITVMKLDVLAKCSKNQYYLMKLSYTNKDGDVVTSGEVEMPPNDSYGKLNKTTIDTDNQIGGVIPEEIDITANMTLRVTGTVGNYTALTTTPYEEVEDIFLAIHYGLS